MIASARPRNTAMALWIGIGLRKISMKTLSKRFLTLVVASCTACQAQRPYGRTAQDCAEGDQKCDLSGSAPDAAAPENNVILITWDGVRPREIFEGADPELWPEEDRPVAVLNPWRQEPMAFGRFEGEFKASAPTTLSLPGYQAIMAGKNTFCFTNSCGAITEQTLPEHLHMDLAFHQAQVAVFGSWEQIRSAASQKKTASFMLNVGFENFRLPYNTEYSKPDMALLTQLASDAVTDKPLWEHARKDEYTWNLAIEYLRVARPRFLWIALNDTDEWGHLNRYHDHVAALQANQARLEQLLSDLTEMPDGYGRHTTVILTTDHGRGNTKDDWQDHGMVQAAAEAWMLAWLPAGLRPVPRGNDQPKPSLSHLDLRPLIEGLFGDCVLEARPHDRERLMSRFVSGFECDSD